MLERMILGANRNYVLLSAHDGKEALERVREEMPDLVLMDVVMPRMGGLEVCKELRRDKNTSEIPIILVTTKSQEKDVEAGFECGCNDYLTKPIDGQELVSIVGSYLGE
jgi:CheY-like chemotaxis protein